MKWLIAFALLVLSGVVRADDPFEVNPYHAVPIVTVPFGPGETRLGPCSPEWGMHEASSFPPFTVGADGTIYLVDGIRSRVMAFSSLGIYQYSLALQKRPSVVDDLVESGGALYWMRGSLRRVLFRIDLATGDTLSIPVSNNPELNLIDGRRTFAALKLDTEPRGVALWNPVDGTRYPVAVDGRILSPDEQFAMRVRGGRSEWPSIGFSVKDTVTTTGERTHGDIVLLDAAGQPEGILARNTSSAQSAAGRLFLYTKCVDSGHPGDEGRCYVGVGDLDGRIVTRTFLPRKHLAREIGLRKEFELKADGSYYQLSLTEDAGQLECHVVRWQR